MFANYQFRTTDQNGDQQVAGERIFKVEEAAAVPPQPEFTAPVLSADLQPQGFSGILRVPGIHFEKSASNVNPAYQDYLAQVAELIRKYPNARVYVEGYAGREEGAAGFLLRLSQERADVVLRYLVEKGKVSPHNLYARGHGASAAPAGAAGGEADRGFQRVNVVILTK
jgi:outer membrane protein OmpA-like peptidoglycan-associated protein